MVGKIDSGHFVKVDGDGERVCIKLEAQLIVTVKVQVGLGCYLNSATST